MIAGVEWFTPNKLIGRKLSRKINRATEKFLKAVSSALPLPAGVEWVETHPIR